MTDLALLVFSVATLLAVVVMAHYLLGKEVFTALITQAQRVSAWVYYEIKEIAGTVARRSWRPLIPFMMIFIMGAIGYRIAMGLPLPNVAEILAVVVPFIIPTLMAQWTRSNEARAGCANGNVVMFPTPLEGGPRPMQNAA